jgi:hypothetical protein
MLEHHTSITERENGKEVGIGGLELPKLPNG